MVICVHAIALAKGGRTAPELAEAVGYSRRGLQFWVKWYNYRGVDALRIDGGQGRKPMLQEAEQRQFRQRLDAGPVPEKDGGVCTPRGVDVQRILKEEFGKVRCLSARCTTCCTRSATAYRRCSARSSPPTHWPT